jgi:hypothetical protein
MIGHSSLRRSASTLKTGTLVGMIEQAAATETALCYGTFTCTENACMHMDKVNGRECSVEH